LFNDWGIVACLLKGRQVFLYHLQTTYNPNQMQWTDKIQVYNENCMQTMARYEDNYFDLAIVDPPYGIGIDKAINANNGKQGFKQYKKTDWDNNTPTQEYFDELFRVSKHQIIWGGNYFIDKIKKPSQGWLIWNKVQRNFTMSDAEIAWSSFDRTIRCFDLSRGGAMGCNNKSGGKRHPTQKPVALYNWILDRYAKPDFKIIDTHLGSGSNAISCHHYGCELVAAELDTDYFNDSFKRFKLNTAQQKLF
jgi:site-specific DNA-methyltransferase (adenine-specific)